MISDLDESGTISWDEFETQLDEPRFHWYVKSFGIDPADAKLLFKLLDHDGSGELDMQELVAGMIRLRAGAKFMDVMKIMHEIERTNRRLGQFLGTDDRYDSLRKLERSFARGDAHGDRTTVRGFEGNNKTTLA
mmetsp:Transcript_134612/g.238145  ORF Transcript_134612/g.238145 Transcript_134612/m.238145 type:complete len:134 (-) Transcript_134612:166-567(-)